MRVGIVIPWRLTDAWRERAREVTEARLRRLLPDAPIIYADSGDRVFNRAASRNQGMRELNAHHAGVSGRSPDVAVICDADTLIEAQPLYHALRAAQRLGRLVLPYTLFRGLTQAETLRLGGWGQFASATQLQEYGTELETTSSTGGALVIRPDRYWVACGQDERFVGWGFEDAAFRIMCDRILGPTRRVGGTIHHLWHPSEIRPWSKQYWLNQRLMGQYEAVERMEPFAAEEVGRLASDIRGAQRFGLASEHAATG